ncbi:BAG family molecular chaperone regulator 2-like [Antedon mediterranea]|uniref:BAG family molecular chaperone regulator 2-like n=1 Tax=Antedon mediterranea TaxID=105859 RepID=UPI003AF58CD1
MAYKNSSKPNDEKMLAICDDPIFDYLLITLDELEKQVESFRDTAKKLQEDKQEILEKINKVSESQAISDLTEEKKDELELYIDRLCKRCITVELSVITVRSTHQEKAILKIKDILKKLKADIQSDTPGTREKITRYLNTCTTDGDGTLDYHFQAILLDCAAEDQKEVKKRLQALWSALVHSEKSVDELCKEFS